MSVCITYLVGPLNRVIKSEPGLTRYDVLRRSLRSVKQYLPALPIIIFHEDYNERQFSELREIIGDITFESVDFSGGQEHFVFRPEEGGDYERQRTYQLMCRFFCGPLQVHPAIQHYDYYMRLDDDSFFIEPKIPDFNALLQHDYTYRSVYTEVFRQSLCDFTARFLEKHNLKPDMSLGTCQDAFNGRAIYSNFHISKLSMWRHPIVKAYLDEIEECHGILAEMWTDSRIQAMIAWLLLPLCGLSSDVITTFGYRHNRHFSQMTHPGEPYYVSSWSFCPPG